jgi:hypothetical protein
LARAPSRSLSSALSVDWDRIHPQALVPLCRLLSRRLQPGTFFAPVLSFIFQRVAGSAVCLLERFPPLGKRGGQASSGRGSIVSHLVFSHGDGEETL